MGFEKRHYDKSPGEIDLGTPIGTGAYTLLGVNPIPINWETVTRNAEATIFLPSEDEWYKAAYYEPVSMGYFDYPLGTDAPPMCAAPGATGNRANCNLAVGDLTGVGSYTAAVSPNGTFDQGGNVWEWNEAILPDSYRGLRGGTLEYSPSFLAASYRFSFPPTIEGHDIGFRVASLPEPEAVPSVSPAGAALLGGLVFGIGIVGLVIAARKRLN